MTESELIAAIEAAYAKSENPEGAYTTEELSALMGIPINAVRKRLRVLKKLGRLDVARKTAEGIDGAMYSVQAYRILS